MRGAVTKRASSCIGRTGTLFPRCVAAGLWACQWRPDCGPAVEILAAAAQLLQGPAAGPRLWATPPGLAPAPAFGCAGASGLGGVPAEKTCFGRIKK